MIKLMFITNNPDLAEYAEFCGVERIFIDLEIIGKSERQGHLDTLISQHSLSDIPIVKSRLKKSQLLVRVNPLHSGTKHEVETAIASGADLLMLPMFRTVREVQLFSHHVDGRVGIIPLIETFDAAQSLQSLFKVKGIYEIFIGLNDLHLDMKLDFMFETLANGFVDGLVETIKKAGFNFGFGGIARVGEGVIPGESVLAEHVRLGSSSVILSRTFHRQSVSVKALKSTVGLKQEIEKLRYEEERLKKRDKMKIEDDKLRLKNIVREFVERKRREASF